MSRRWSASCCGAVSSSRRDGRSPLRQGLQDHVIGNGRGSTPLRGEPHAVLWSLHGLTVRATVPLPALPAADVRAPDAELVLGRSEPVPDDPPEGRLLAELRIQSAAGSSYVKTPSGYVARYHRTCDFRVDRSLRRIEAVPDPGADPALVPLLFSGGIIAFLLEMRSACVLHASGIEVDGAALAIAGASGQGKSTLAALLCAAGARLISDDVLRIGRNGHSFCYLGSPVLRLREGAGSLTTSFPPDRIGRSPDGRITVLPEVSPAERVRLRSIVIPHPSRGVAKLRVERLRPRDALLALTRYPRIPGWKVADRNSRFFRALAEIARTVPAFEATIPWGPPFGPAIGEQILRRAGSLDMNSNGPE